MGGHRVNQTRRPLTHEDVVKTSLIAAYIYLSAIHYMLIRKFIVSSYSLSDEAIAVYMEYSFTYRYTC